MQIPHWSRKRPVSRRVIFIRQPGSAIKSRRDYEGLLLFVGRGCFPQVRKRHQTSPDYDGDTADNSPLALTGHQAAATNDINPLQEPHYADKDDQNTQDTQEDSHGFLSLLIMMGQACLL